MTRITVEDWKVTKDSPKKYIRRLNCKRRVSGETYTFKGFIIFKEGYPYYSCCITVEGDKGYGKEWISERKTLSSALTWAGGILNIDFLDTIKKVSL